MNYSPVQAPRSWSVSITAEQLQTWVRPVLDAGALPAIAQMAIELLLRQWAGKRVRLSAELDT